MAIQMKKLLTALLLLTCLIGSGQIVNDWYDSTAFHGGVSVNSHLRIPTGASDGYVLTSNSIGISTWQAPPASVDTNQLWKIHGNSGTNDATNFIGTTDNQDLRFRVNNTNMGRLEYDSRNVAFGRQAMNAVTTGSFNVSIGNRSSLAMTTGGQNVVVGGTAFANNTTGSFNVIIGYDAGTTSDTADHTVAIGHGAIVSCDSCIVIGDSTTHTYTGIGTSFPTEKLHVHGSIRMVDGNQAAGYVMKSDANGVGSWQTAAVDSSQIVGTILTNKGGTGLTSYTQGDLIYYNSGTSFSKLAKNTTATRYLSNTGSSNNPAWAQVDLTNGVTGVLPNANGGCDSWTDYSATSTIVGWSSFTTKQLVYSRCGKTVFVRGYFVGTSNSTSVTFTLPFANTSVSRVEASVVYSADNGIDLTTSGLLELLTSSSTVSILKTPSSPSWTNSGTKITGFQFTYNVD